MCFEEKSFDTDVTFMTVHLHPCILCTPHSEHLYCSVNFYSLEKDDSMMMTESFTNLCSRGNLATINSPSKYIIKLRSIYNSSKKD